jgi:TonB family protein
MPRSTSVRTAGLAPFVACAVLAAVSLSRPAYAIEETVRREYVDAGVHVPVMTQAPVLLTFVEAVYPEEAKAQGLTAVVKLRMTLGPDGSVLEARPVEPAGHGFDEAAIEAVMKFQFTPAEVDGAPAAIELEYIYHFVLGAADAGTAEGTEEDGGVKQASAALVGHLVTRGSRTPVAGALLHVACAGRSEIETMTGSDGEFRLEGLGGDCRFSAISPDHEAFRTTESLEEGEVKEVRYFIMPKAVGFQTVVRGQREKKEVVKRTLSRQEMQKVPGSFGDPVRVIQNFPGVARAPFLLGQLIVRGANPNQTLTFFDGVEIPLLFHIGGGPSVVNGEFLDRVDFFPGGFGARYGRAVGGVVDVASRKGATDTWHGVAKVDLLDSSLFFEAPIAKNVSVAAAARRSYVDVLIPLVLPKDPQGGALLVLPVYWDYQVRVDVGGKRGEKPGDGASTYSLFAFGSDDLLRVVATGGARSRDVKVEVHTSFHRVLGTWIHRSGRATFKLTPYGGLDLMKIDVASTTLRADRWSLGLRQDFEVEATERVTLRAGADIIHGTIGGEADLPVISGTQYVAFPGAEPKAETQHLRVKLTAFDGAMYAESDLKFGSLTVTPGIRGSHAYLSGQTRSAVEPRLWIRYEPLPGTAVKGSAGLYTQPPPVTSMQAPPFGTPALTHERAFQSSLGVFQKLTEELNVDVTGFYNRRYENVASPGSTAINADGSVTRFREGNSGLGNAYGMEVMLRHEVTKRFFGWLAYTLSRSEQSRAGSSDPYRLATFDQTHILTAVGSLRLPWGFELGARFRYVTGRPKTPLVRGADIYQADSNRYAATFGDDRSARVKDFHQLDIRLDKYFVFKTWTLNAYIDVQNVYNAQNVEGSFFDYRFRQEYEVPGIPILPVLGIKATL